MANYAYLRAFVCLIFGSLVTFQIAFAQSDSSKPFSEYIYQKQTWQRFWYTAQPTNGYNPVPATAPVPSANPVGKWNIIIDPQGAPAANTKVPFKFPNSAPEVADATAKFKMRDLAGALARFAQKVFVPLSIGSAIWDLARELGFWLSRNPDGSLKIEKDGVSDELRPYYGSSPVITGNTPESVCTQITSTYPAFGTFTYFSRNDLYGNLQGRCQYTSGSNAGVSRCPTTQALINGSCQPVTGSKIPATQQELEDAIANKPDWSPTSKIVPAIRDAINAEPNADKRPKTELPTITGPSSSTAPTTKTETKPDGSTSTTTTTNTYNYPDNSVKIITTVTNNHNSVTNTTTTTTTTDDSGNDTKDFCADHPDSPACASMDTPEVEIPKSTKNVTFIQEQLFGGGVCPAAKTFTYFGVSHSISYQGTCDALSNYVRFIVIASATFSAFMMILSAIRK